MDAVQRMRAKAQVKGTLKPTEQMKVETKVVENKQVIVIEQADPQVIYVPSYDPVVVYGPAAYPYPPIYYPPPGYHAAGLFVSFGVGVMMGAFWSGGWCCGAGWGGNNVYINHNSNFNRNSNIGGNRPSQLPNRGGEDRGGLGNGGVLHEIFGPGGDDVYLTGEYPQDRQRALDFAAEAREKKNVSTDPKTGNRAFLIVGDENWPFPVPLVKVGNKWHFDPKTGRQELLYRRIGSNELDAIDICNGFVGAQYEYAYQPREEHDVNQFAQRIISTPGKQDGLAWQNADGTWGGPVGEKIARAIEQGYSATAQPYHGYFYKILKGQGPAAPLGEMDYVVKDAMIGGFALVAPLLSTVLLA
jgi:hypothetical protein